MRRGKLAFPFSDASRRSSTTPSQERPWKPYRRAPLLPIPGRYRVGGSLSPAWSGETRYRSMHNAVLWGNRFNHFADQGDCRGIVQRGKGHRLLEILEDFIRDPLVPVEARPGMHHAVAYRLDFRHSGARTRHPLAGLLGLPPRRACRGGLNSRPPASRKVNSSPAPPIPLISPVNRLRGHAGLLAEPPRPAGAGEPASNMENLIDDEPLLMTSMCTPPSRRPTDSRYTRGISRR